MPRAARLLLPLALISALASCHTDPFGLKPEVRGVEIPDKPVEAEPEETVTEAEAPQP